LTLLPGPSARVLLPTCTLGGLPLSGRSFFSCNVGKGERHSDVASPGRPARCPRDSYALHWCVLVGRGLPCVRARRRRLLAASRVTPSRPAISPIVRSWSAPDAHASQIPAWRTNSAQFHRPWRARLSGRPASLVPRAYLGFLGAAVPQSVALRGCPMCWTVGLVETLSQG
jgi:hypothetical protein